MKGITLIDHAADVGMDVYADSLSELFSRAAVGMTSLMFADEPINRTGSAHVTHEIEVEASDASALLVAWLRELLYLHAMQDFAYVSATFNALTETRLQARATGVTHPDAGGREIKGVTYHGLDVANRDGTWRARVIFDV